MLCHEGSGEGSSIAAPPRPGSGAGSIWWPHGQGRRSGQENNFIIGHPARVRGRDGRWAGDDDRRLHHHHRYYRRHRHHPHCSRLVPPTTPRAIDPTRGHIVRHPCPPLPKCPSGWRTSHYSIRLRASEWCFLFLK